MTHSIDVYLEVGKKRTFAGAIEWPGWCRSGRDEQSALQELLDYGPRYARVLQSAPRDFQAPDSVSAFTVVEQLEGTGTTDFGAPAIAPSADARPLDDDEQQHLLELLQACWKAFDAAVEMARGEELRKGPRGGGRELEGIIEHVLGADAGYLSTLGKKYKKDENSDLQQELAAVREAILENVPRAARGEFPERGPRGGKRWSPRYFVRRSAWHILDHAWEIEDRVI